jgi:hypothetical protein
MATHQRGRASLPQKEKQPQRGQILAPDTPGRQTYATHPTVTCIEYASRFYSSYIPYRESTEIRHCRNTRQGHQRSLRRSKEKGTHGFPIFAEELSPDAPQIISTGTCRQRRIGPAARWSFDKLFSYSVRRFPFSANLLRRILC